MIGAHSKSNFQSFVVPSLCFFHLASSPYSFASVLCTVWKMGSDFFLRPFFCLNIISLTRVELQFISKILKWNINISVKLNLALSVLFQRGKNEIYKARQFWFIIHSCALNTESYFKVVVRFCTISLIQLPRCHLHGHLESVIIYTSIGNSFFGVPDKRDKNGFSFGESSL